MAPSPMWKSTMSPRFTCGYMRPSSYAVLSSRVHVFMCSRANLRGSAHAKPLTDYAAGTGMPAAAHPFSNLWKAPSLISSFISARVLYFRQEKAPDSLPLSEAEFFQLSQTTHRSRKPCKPHNTILKYQSHAVNLIVSSWSNNGNPSHQNQ